MLLLIQANCLATLSIKGTEFGFFERILEKNQIRNDMLSFHDPLFHAEIIYVMKQSLKLVVYHCVSVFKLNCETLDFNITRHLVYRQAWLI